ncbi:MAG: glycosyltransferase [Deltaproteobacteria bacterium]|nr:glycosyltransferase [Deltaproteobacteria bacterium]
MDLSIVIPAKNEAENLADVVGGARAVCSGIGAQHEILVAVSADDAATAKAAEAAGARVVIQPGAGYGDALLAGFAKANGEYVLSMDADLSHPPEFIAPLWEGAPKRGPRDREPLRRRRTRRHAGLPLLALAHPERVFPVGIGLKDARPVERVSSLPPRGD